jgi:hypothetical protein
LAEFTSEGSVQRSAPLCELCDLLLNLLFFASLPGGACFTIQRSPFDALNACSRQASHQPLQLQEKTNGAEDPGTLRTRDNLATALEHEGEPEEAESEYRAVLNLREKVLGVEHPDTLLTCLNLAQCLRAQNKSQEANEFGQRALQGARKILGADHPFTKKCEKLVEELG